MDVNGFKGPNSEARNGKQYDIRSFKVAKFSKGCAGNEIKGVGCVYKLPSYSPIKAGSEEMDKWDPKWNSKSCIVVWDGYCKKFDNYWAGAKKACDELGMSLPDKSKLQSISQAAKKDSSLGLLPTSGLEFFWSSSEYEKGAGDVYGVYFGGGIYNANTTNFGKFDSRLKVLCVGD